MPIYRRKATIPAIRRTLTGIGWQGEIEETFRRALRIGSRPRLNASKLPGEIYSLAVYRLICLSQTAGVRDAIVFHHPAGTRVFFWQWLLSQVTYQEDLSALEKLIVRRVLLGELDEAFDLNRKRLGSCFHLTRKQRVTEFIPSPKEKREALIHDHILELVGLLHERLCRIEAESNDVPELAERSTNLLLRIKSEESQNREINSEMVSMTRNNDESGYPL